MSWYEGAVAPGGRESDIKNSSMAKFTMRIISPIVLIVGAYLIMNGHISAGGGFQGGLAIATFFICRYMVYDIYDMPIKKVMKIEELVFINITIIPILAIFMGFVYMLIGNPPLFQEIYLTVMNILIGLKVACGFFILFYRYIAIERLSDYEEGEVRVHDS
jgi:multicomponent Na+:H+ antiporter subunit B